VLLVSCDVYRPAAIEQLRTLAEQLKIDFFPSDNSQKPQAIALAAHDWAKKHHHDVLIVDTAGRLAVDEAMMAEIKDLHAALKPIETLFVVDAMTGQDAVNTAKAFGETLPLTGVILTKLAGDARGGAALSVRQITGKPIKFVGVSEKPNGLEAFHPERMAQRILGMGDVLSLVERAQAAMDQTQAEDLAGKIREESFTLEDFAQQLKQLRSMGPLGQLMDMVPFFKGGKGMPRELQGEEHELQRFEAIIASMTPGERTTPAIINGGRRARIARGSGTSVSDVNRLLKQHAQLKKMMKGLKQMEGRMGKLKGALPFLPR